MKTTLAIVLALLVGFLVIQHALIKADESEIKEYKMQINQLKAASEAQAKIAAAAHTEAVIQMRQIQGESNAIIKEKVPTNCEAAIQWFAQEVKRA